jgi:rhodanese-related sulfurtransferase
MPNKILGILVIIGAIVGLVVLVGSNINRQEDTTEQKANSQVKEAQVKSPIIKDVTTAEAQSLIQKNQLNKGFVIIDVRTPSEYISGHIENAVNIDYSSTAFSDEVGKLDKNKAYLVYCRSGSRSKKAVAIMSELGFSEIYNLSGGITGWSAEGLPIVR